MPDPITVYTGFRVALGLAGVGISLLRADFGQEASVTNEILKALPGGVVGNLAYDLLKGGAAELSETAARLAQGDAKNLNHDLQRAARKAQLTATLLAARACAAELRRKESNAAPLWSRLPARVWRSDEVAWLESLAGALQQRIDALPREIPQTAATYGDLIELFDTRAAAPTPAAFVAEMREDMLREIRADIRTNTPFQPDAYELLAEALSNGWNETAEAAPAPSSGLTALNLYAPERKMALINAGRQYDWFSLVCGFFNEEYKNDPRVQAAMQKYLLLDLRDAAGENLAPDLIMGHLAQFSDSFARLEDWLRRIDTKQDALLEFVRGQYDGLRAGLADVKQTVTDTAGATQDVVRKYGEKILDKLSDKPPPPFATAVTAQFGIPAPVGDFVGREAELDEICAALRSGDGRVSVSAVSGMGGVGKTQVVLAAAARVAGLFKGAQLYINLRGTDETPPPAHEALKGLLRALLGPEAVLPEEAEALRQSYLTALHGKRALVVLDNAADDEQVGPLLPPSGCAVLITSRNVLESAETALVLDEWPLAKAVEFISEKVKRLTPEQADELARLCGRLPLALRAAGGTLRRRLDVGAEKYLAELREERTRLGALKSKLVPDGVAAAFALSYRLLTPELARVFRALGVFPADFNAAGAEAVAGDPRHELTSELCERSLVQYDTKKERYRLHDLLRVYARECAGADERQAAALHAAHYKTVLAQADELFLQGHDNILAGLRLYDAESANILAGQAWAAARWATDDAAARLCIEYPDAGAYVLSLRQTPTEQIVWLKLQLSSARKLGDKQAEGAALGNLGLAYAALGETRRAIEFYEQCLKLHREIGDRRGEGNSLWNMADEYYNKLGDKARGVELAEDALRIFEALEDPNAAKVRGWLARWKG